MNCPLVDQKPDPGLGARRDRSRMAVTSRLAREAPSAICAAPAAARVNSRSKVSCGFSRVCLTVEAVSGPARRALRSAAGDLRISPSRLDLPCSARGAVSLRPSLMVSNRLAKRWQIPGRRHSRAHLQHGRCLPEPGCQRLAVVGAGHCRVGFERLIEESGLPVRVNPVFSSSQIAARSLAAPSVRPFLKQPGTVGKLMKAIVDLAQPRSQPGTRERLRAAQRLGCRAHFAQPALVRQAAGSRRRSRPALPKNASRCPTRAPRSAERACPGRTSTPPGRNHARSAVLSGISLNRS